MKVRDYHCGVSPSGLQYLFLITLLVLLALCIAVASIFEHGHLSRIRGIAEGLGGAGTGPGLPDVGAQAE